MREYEDLTRAVELYDSVSSLPAADRRDDFTERYLEAEVAFERAVGRYARESFEAAGLRVITYHGNWDRHGRYLRYFIETGEDVSGRVELGYDVGAPTEIYLQTLDRYPVKLHQIFEDVRASVSMYVKASASLRNLDDGLELEVCRLSAYHDHPLRLGFQLDRSAAAYGRRPVAVLLYVSTQSTLGRQLDDWWERGHRRSFEAAIAEQIGTRETSRMATGALYQFIADAWQSLDSDQIASEANTVAREVVLSAEYQQGD